MKSVKFVTRDPGETMKFGEGLASCLRPSDIVCLFGELGSGKTTLVKGLAKGMRISDKKVSSPTFILMNLYEGKIPLYHFDLYRLGDSDGLRSIGYDEFLYGDGIAVVEWAERLGALLPQEYLAVYLDHCRTEGERTIVLKAVGRKYEEVLQAWQSTSCAGKKAGAGGRRHA